MSKSKNIELKKKDFLLKTITDFSVVADNLAKKGRDDSLIWRAVGTLCHDLSKSNNDIALQILKNRVKDKQSSIVYIQDSERKLKEEFTSDFQKELIGEIANLSAALATITKQNKEQAAQLKESDKKNQKENKEHYRSGIILSVKLMVFSLVAGLVLTDVYGKMKPVAKEYYNRLYVQPFKNKSKRTVPVNDKYTIPFIVSRSIQEKCDRTGKAVSATAQGEIIVKRDSAGKLTL